MTALSAPVNALVPSENWDDDFEFQQSSTSNSPVKRKQKPTRQANDHDAFSARMSVASSQFTEDWDAEGSFSSPTRSPKNASSRSRSGSLSHKSAASKTSIPPQLAQWVEEDDDDHPEETTLSRRLFADVTTSKINSQVEENWDDDFEDSTGSPLASAATVHKASTAAWDEPPAKAEENWDDDFEDRSPGRPQPTAWEEDLSKLKTPRRPRRKPAPPVVDSGSDNDPLSSDDDAEFGFVNDRDEDRTVTARSRRTALARLSPPPVPDIPSPFQTPVIPTIPSSSSPHPFPAPRSPTSSVFSVPNADARSYTSTTYLRSTVSRASSGHGHGSLSHLPPSPPIHKSRERRRLRKKSRPPQASNPGVYEMKDLGPPGRKSLGGGARTTTYPYAYPYHSFSDGELEEIRDVEEDDRIHSRIYNPPRTPSPPPVGSSYLQATQPLSVPVTPSRSMGGASTSLDHSENPMPSSSTAAATVPSTPSASTTRAGALLSRIGSVTKKGWVRRKRGASVTASDAEKASDVSPPKPLPIRHSLQQQRPLNQPGTPRPRSSLSSLHHANNRPSSRGHVNHGAHSTANLMSTSPPSSAQNPTPPTSSNWFFRNTSNASGRHSSGGYHSRSGSLSDLSVREQEYADPSRPNHTTPSKLIKRKSLGFVQLRRGVGGHNHGENEDVAAENGDAVEDAALPRHPRSSSKRPMSMAVGLGVPGGDASKRGTTRHASYGAASGARERKKSVINGIMGRARSGSKSSVNEAYSSAYPGTADTTDRETDLDDDKPPPTPKDKSSSSLASGVRAFMGNVRRLSIVGGKNSASGGAEGSGGKSPAGKSPGLLSRHQRTKSGASIPVKSLVDSVAGRTGSRSGTPTGAPPRPLTPSTSYPHLSSAVGLRRGDSQTKGRMRSGSQSAASRSESRCDSRLGGLDSRPGSRSGLGGPSLLPSAPSIMSSRQVSSGSSASAVSTTTSGGGSVSSVPMPPPLPTAPRSTSSGRRSRSGSASSAYSNRRTSISNAMLEDNQKTPKAPTKTYHHHHPHYPPKTPDKPPPLPLLPPIELHPPSPPKGDVLDDEDGPGIGRYQSLGLSDSSTSLSPSLSPKPTSSPGSQSKPPQSSFSPTSNRSLSPIASVASPTASPKTIKEPSTISPKSILAGSTAGSISPSTSTATAKLLVRPPASPGQLQSASLGRSAASSVVAGTAATTSTSSSSVSSSTAPAGGGGAGGVPRRNSLGDLKIPARISQAQSSLRRDLGMVREFAGHVENMKSLQTTYDVLVNEVQMLLEKHAAGWYAHQQTSPPPPSTTPTSPNFFNNLAASARSGAMKVRRRSYTNPEASAVTPSETPPLPTASMKPEDLAAAKAAYKDLATAFYTINSKYRISWECAELLVELGSGSGGGGSTSATTSPVKGSGSTGTIGQSLAASASTTTFGPPHLDGHPGIKGKRSRERAITLAGDESRPSTPSGMVLASPVRPSMEAPTILPHTPQPSSHLPPLASPPSWRGSTGRHDLSQRQLALLKEMLNNPDPTAASSPSAIPEEAAPSPGLSTPFSSPLSNPSASNLNLNVNRDWKWGNDPMASTVTLPSEEDSIATGENQQGGTDSTRRKRKRLNMSGFRDMLRALRKGGGVIDTSGASSPGEAYNSKLPATVSTASLSVDSSADGHSQMDHQRRDDHPRLGRSPNQPAHRRVQNDGGSERMGEGSPGERSETYGRVAAPYTNPKLPPKSPRRPSLASIFRIGIGGKNKGGGSGGGGLGVTDGAPVSAPESAASSRVPSGTSTGGDSGHRADVDDDLDDARGRDDEEDWDQIDSASDLDGHAPSGGGKSYGKLGPGGEGGATIRASSTTRGKKLRKPNSPYLQQDPYAARSTSGFSTKRNASASQISLNLSSDSSSVNVATFSPTSGAGQTSAAAMVTPRPIRLSNVEESQAESPVWPIRTTSLAQNQHLLKPGTNPSGRSVSGSSSKFHTTGPSSSKTGSLRSMAPPSSQIRPHSQVQAAPTLALTPENIKPLLENAREVQARLNDCIAEVQTLLVKAKETPIPPIASPNPLMAVETPSVS